MTLRLAAATLLAGALTVLIAPAGSGSPASNGSPAAHRSPAAGFEIDELAWISGHWEGTGLGGELEEVWLEPAGNALSGQFRLVREGMPVMYELLLIERDEDGEIYYRFKHITPGWEPLEETRLEYRLTELEGREATFRSTAAEPVPNAPWWFTYERTGDGRLLVSIHGTSGDPIVLEMRARGAGE